MGLVVTIHELGHYYAGRMFGAAVESFSFGFGKSITEKRDRRGTRWRINRYPIGGFVKFIGEHQTAGDVGEGNTGSVEIVGKPFPELTVGQRSVIALAGPIANFCLAILLFAVMFLANGKNMETMSVAVVSPGSPAEAAGFEVGDKLVEIDGSVAESRRDLFTPVQLGTGNKIPFVVERQGERVELTVVPERELIETALGTKQRMGKIGLGPTYSDQFIRSFNPITAIGEGAHESWWIVSVTSQLLGRIIIGKESIHNLAGPVGIGDVGRRVTNQTLGAVRAPLGTRIWAFTWSMVQICALVSIGIGLFNLLPLPVLDGGHLVFNAYEAVTGKVMPERVMEYSLRFGLVLLLTMAVFITYGDIIETGVFGSEGDSQP